MTAFSAKKIVTNKQSGDFKEYSRVWTFDFVDKILAVCETQGDKWALSVQSRTEYFGRDLHAADALYHHTCAINFRTGKGVPVNYSDPPPNKRKKPGRPKDTDQEQASERMCLFFEENDEEGFTISQLSEKIKGYLQDQTSMSYGNSYLKSQLLKRYGDSV